MGQRNSSTTRVAPVFNRLFASDPSGASWLAGLLKGGSRAAEADIAHIQPLLIQDHPVTWGSMELSLPTPLSLLEYLVQNIASHQVSESRDRAYTREKRDALARRDADTVQEALRALRGGRRGRKWYVLEGASKPDATFEMDDAVLLVEGKRTERSCTSATTWMGVRSQLVRHMDAASEHFRGKRILGLLLVEGEGGADGLRPSQHWKDESAAQYEPSMLSASLPHRSRSERHLIASGILGVATWQAICAQNQIPWPPEKYPA